MQTRIHNYGTTKLISLLRKFDILWKWSGIW